EQEGVARGSGGARGGGGGDRCVKLYVNASDASRAARARLCTELAPGAFDDHDAAAVIGMNARADGRIERKLYVQAADALELADRARGPARPRGDAGPDEAAEAGGRAPSRRAER